MPIPTPHIELSDISQIAKTVIMPGDPLRAKLIADSYLSNVIQINSVRNMLGYTGEYKGHKVSVMGSGMGMPSMGIYSYELYSFYGVENIIRVGSAGSYSADLGLYEVVLAKDAWSESSYAKVQGGYDKPFIEPSDALNARILAAASSINTPVRELRIHSSDVFYRERFEDYIDINREYGCACVEMEAFALFANAKALNKHAACLLTISDSLVTHEATTSEERQNSFTKMLQIALEASI
ncbi:purine-nucleoside phosphorylase [Aquella oligotrophica]|uniref:Uridine phosphorylase n=1 Tax=Aquella oligotrophica TaxID=2067065 RepID=A0A2I7N3K9_9NEIS|nr:purine-nucleoside phosphorylase [Aquella oligotrophica]AUR51033.1 purine-nucleoside phosphorylase [Aquella oligotrophica]